MRVQKALATIALGVGIGAVALPVAAFADVSASPSSVPVGGTVTLNSSCSIQFGQADFHITGPNRDIHVQSTGSAGQAGGLAAQVFTAGFTPGTYNVTATCGNGQSAGTTTFQVTPAGPTPAGDGSSTDNSGMVAAGATLLGAAATTGVVLIRRRRPTSKAA
jgi:hypothetical protein